MAESNATAVVPMDPKQLEELLASITTQGEVVREMKAAGKEKASRTLLIMYTELCLATGCMGTSCIATPVAQEAVAGWTSIEATRQNQWCSLQSLETGEGFLHISTLLSHAMSGAKPGTQTYWRPSDFRCRQII